MARKSWSRHEDQEMKPEHRPIEDIKRDIANTPAQGLAALHAELDAAEQALAKPVEDEGGEG